MNLEEQLLDVEKQLWRNDAELYQHHLIPEALLVFPETGVITRDVAIAAIRGGKRGRSTVGRCQVRRGPRRPALG